MKKLILTALAASLAATAPAAVNPSGVEYTVKPMYGHRADGKPGRIITAKLSGDKLSGKFTVEAKAGRKKEKTVFNIDSVGQATVDILLPDKIGVDNNEKVILTLKTDGAQRVDTLDVEAVRHWNVFLLNHSHVDIGYTNTHKNIETLHKSNVIEGMRIGQETHNYPEGSRFVWNPEVTWPTERLWNDRPELRDSIISAIRLGHITVDASYVNLNTSICADEELFHVFKFSRDLQRRSGVPADVFQQFDIPGISWGIVPVLANQGVKYIISWPNGDRAGHSHEGLDGTAFWWAGPDGQSKVLFFQPGQYANSGSMDKGGQTGRPWLGQRNPAKVPAVIKMGYANVDFTSRLADLANKGYPYDFAAFSWSLWDNNPVDADIPDAVRAWNEKYAYPKIKICGSHEIMAMIDEKYGDQLPTVTGDFTEFWTDGLGTAADLTRLNRNSKERIIQAETLTSLLADGTPAPRADLDEAWRYIILGSEHTWCFEQPNDIYFGDAILRVKRSYFHEADERSRDLMDMALAPATDKANGAFGPYDGPAEGGVTVVNTHSWPHGGIVTLNSKESMRGNRVVDDNDREVLSQRLSTGELIFLADEIPAFGSAHYRVAEGDCTLQGDCLIDGNTLSNSAITISIDPATGNISSMKLNGDDYNYASAEGLNRFVWLPANVDEPQADKVTRIEVSEQGPLAVELRVISEAHGCNAVERTIRLLSGQPWVEMANMVDKAPLPEKDGVHFGFNFNIPDATTRIDIPWGVMRPELDQWKQANRNWMAVQRWADVSNDTHGVTWCSLDAPLMEYGGRFANIAMSWGSAGDWKTALPEKSSEIYSWVMNNHWHTNFPQTQEGPVTFRYRMMPHAAGYDASQANRFGLAQAQPLAHVAAKNASSTNIPISIDNPNVFSTIVKSGVDQADGRTVLIRLRSVSDKPESVKIGYPSSTPASAYICDIEETPAQPIPADNTLNLPPYSMTTLLLKY